MKKILMLVGVLVVLIGALLALKLADGKRKDPEAVRARVNQYWEAVRINDLTARYQLLTGYAEGTLQPDQLPPQLSAQLKILSYRVGKITLEEDGLADVEVELEMTLPNFQGKGFMKKRRETWSYVGDNWYRGLRGEYLEELKKEKEERAIQQKEMREGGRVQKQNSRLP